MREKHPSAFDYAFERTVVAEGGGKTTSYDWDPGGLTRWGISQNANPDIDVANLTKSGARYVYRTRYWNPSRCGEIKSHFIAARLFDMAVNLGVSTAVLIAQRGWNYMSPSDRLEEDGVIGPKTLRALNKAGFRRTPNLLAWIGVAQGNHYLEIAKNNNRLGDAAIAGWGMRLLPPKEILT